MEQEKFYYTSVSSQPKKPKTELEKSQEKLWHFSMTNGKYSEAIKMAVALAEGHDFKSYTMPKRISEKEFLDAKRISDEQKERDEE